MGYAGLLEPYLKDSTPLKRALGAIQRWRFEATGREVVGRRVFDFRLGG